METDKKTRGKVIVVRTPKCRKSDVIIRFLQKHNIPHEVYILGRDRQAESLARKFRILASPGIIVGGQILNPYHLIENCQVKEPEKTKEKIQSLLATPVQEER